MNAASYYSHCTTRCSVVIIPGLQRFCFTGALYLPKSHDRRWVPTVVTAFRGSIRWASLTPSATAAGTRSPGVHPSGFHMGAKMSCLGCQGFILPDRTFLKPHAYFSCHLKTFWKPCSKHGGSLQVLLFLSCLKSFMVQKAGFCKFAGGFKKTLKLLYPIRFWRSCSHILWECSFVTFSDAWVSFLFWKISGPTFA